MVDDAASAVDDMVRAVVVVAAAAAAAAVEGQAAEEEGERWARPFLTTSAVVVDEWRRTLAAFEKARMGEALREASTVNASAMGDTFII